jgi:hypothetical protein
MKKILVVLLAILVTGGLFAQITFTGSLSTGLEIKQTDEDPDDKDPKVRLYNNDDGISSRFYLTGAVEYDQNFGVSFGFYGKPDSDVSVAYDYARLYGEFLDDMLKITAGATTGTAWGTEGRLDAGFDSLKGVKLEVKPITGLNFGFQLRAEPEGDMTAEQWIKETVIGAKYDTDLFRVVVALGLDSDYQGAGDYDTKVVTAEEVAEDPELEVVESDEGKKMRALFGVQIKAVPNLTANLHGTFLGLGDLDQYGVATIAQNAGYKVTPALEVGAGFTEKLNLRGDDYKNPDASTFRFEAEPYVTYKLSDLITLNLSVPFATGWNGDAVAAADVSYDLGVKPKATFAVNDHASINTFYKLGLKQLDVEGSDAVTTHTVQVNFSWSF